MSRKVVRETLFYAAGLVATRAIGFLLLPINTHLLSSVDYGRLELIVAFADVGSLLFSLGLQTALSRFVGTVENWAARQVICADLFGIAVITAIGLGGAAEAAAGSLVQILPGNIHPNELRLLLLALSVEGLINIGLAWLRMRGRAASFMTITIGRAIVQATVSTGLLWQGFGVAGVLTGTAAGALLQAAAVAILLLGDCGIRFGANRLRMLVIYCGPMLLSAMAGFVLGSFDRWLLVDVVGPSELARYGVAVRVAVIVAILVQPFQMWWFPSRFIVLNGPNGHARSVQVVTIGIVLTLLAGAGVAMAGPATIALMTPADYHGALFYVPVLAIAYAAQETGSLLNVGCYDRDDGFLMLGINLAAAAIALSLYFALIPRFHVPGAIAATLGGQVARLIIFHVISQRQVRLHYPTGRLVLFTIALCLGVGLVFAVTDRPFLLAGFGAPVMLGLWLLAIFLDLVPPFPFGGSLKISR